MNEQIAEELKVLRLRKKLTLIGAAEKIGIDVGTLCRYENNKTSMTIEKLEHILKGYEEEISIFFENVCANIHKKENQ